MATIFISFRQEAQDVAWRLVNYLNHHGDETFFDMHHFGAGDFRDSIRGAIESSSAVIVIVSRNWLEESPSGAKSPGEWVQIELELALASKTPIVPVLVHDTTMPQPEHLPVSIRDFAFQQAAVVRSDAHFDDDAAMLSAMLDQVVPSRKRVRWWRRIFAAARNR